VKIGLDGAVESGTSPMVDGYADPSIEAVLVIEIEKKAPTACFLEPIWGPFLENCRVAYHSSTVSA